MDSLVLIFSNYLVVTLATIYNPRGKLDKRNFFFVFWFETKRLAYIENAIKSHKAIQL